MIIARRTIAKRIEAAIARAPVTVLTGPRQSGKTTLAREFQAEDSVNYFDLEDPVSLSRLEEPRTALEPLEGLVVIDEIQRRPELFPVLRVLVDRRERPARFLILGSASGDLLRQSSESLAGRVERIEIGGFTLEELGSKTSRKLWRRGGFPLAYLARSEQDSLAWRKQFIQTGWYSNAARGGRRRRQGQTEATPTACAEPGAEAQSRRLSWLQLIRKVYEIESLLCTFCGATMRIVAAFIVERSSLRRILQHLDGDCQQPEPLAHSPPAEAEPICAPA